MYNGPIIGSNLAKINKKNKRRKIHISMFMDEMEDYISGLATHNRRYLLFLMYWC
jgi:nucleoside 2-deoxyribosyltransferase